MFTIDTNLLIVSTFLSCAFTFLTGIIVGSVCFPSIQSPPTPGNDPDGWLLPQVANKTLIIKEFSSFDGTVFPELKKCYDDVRSSEQTSEEEFIYYDEYPLRPEGFRL